MVSMKEIAEKLNISRTTVSNILNNKLKEYSYKQETVEKVLNTAKMMGYTPNKVALSLKTGKSKVIALVVPDISNDFYVNIIKKIEDLSQKQGYSLIICFTEESLEKENNYLELIESRMIDGVLIAPVSYEKSLSKKSYPFEIVCFDRTIKSNKFPSVSINNYEAAKQLTNSLLENDIKYPLFMAGSKQDITNIERLRGFQDSLMESGIKLDENNIIFEVYDDESSFQKLNKFILHNNKFDSIYLGSNYSIYGVMKSLNENNIYKIPIAGFENFKGSEFFSFNFYKVEQPEKRIAHESFKSLITLLSNQIPNDIILKAKIN